MYFKYSVVTSVHNVVDCCTLHPLCTLHLLRILLLYSLYTSAGRYRIYCCTRNLVRTLLYFSVYATAPRY